MKTNELMISDWVLHEGESYQIRQLGIYGENRDGEDYPAVCIGKPNGIGLIVERNKIESITLTAEILEKNGFVKYRNCSTYHILTKDYFLIEIRNVEGNMAVWTEWIENNDGIYCDYLLPYPKYVHQLQHALRLCNIDKEIEL